MGPAPLGNQTPCELGGGGEFNNKIADGKTYAGAATVAHEGQHGVDRANGINPGNSLSALRVRGKSL